MMRSRDARVSLLMLDAQYSIQDPIGGSSSSDRLCRKKNAIVYGIKELYNLMYSQSISLRIFPEFYEHHQSTADTVLSSAHSYNC
jgi:hypothetical protein